MFCEKPSKNKRGRGKLLGLEKFFEGVGRAGFSELICRGFMNG